MLRRRRPPKALRPALRSPSPPWGEGARRAGEGESASIPSGQSPARWQPMSPSPPWGEGAERAGEGESASIPLPKPRDMATHVPLAPVGGARRRVRG